MHSTMKIFGFLLQMENNVIVSDYTQMDRVLREERQYILDICKKVKKAGCNVLLIQKSILRYVGINNLMLITLKLMQKFYYKASCLLTLQFNDFYL